MTESKMLLAGAAVAALVLGGAGVARLSAQPANGTEIVEYQNQLVDNPFKENAWLRAIAMKPGDRRVLHDVVSQHVPDPTAPRPAIPGGSVGSYAPGAEPQVFGNGAGAPAPGGGKLTFQTHQGHPK